LAYQCSLISSVTQATREEQAFDLSSFDQIMQCTVCILVLIFVDIVLAPTPASVKAEGAMHLVLIQIRHLIQTVFEEKDGEGKLKNKGGQKGLLKFEWSIGKGKLVEEVERQGQLKFEWNIVKESQKGLGGKDKYLASRAVLEKDWVNQNLFELKRVKENLNEAGMLGGEAADELRWGLEPWPTDYFSMLVERANNLKNIVNVCDCVFKGSDDQYDSIFRNNSDGDECDRIFHTNHATQSFQNLNDSICKLLEYSLEIVDIILGTKDGKTEKFKIQDIVKEVCKLTSKKMWLDLMKEMDAHLKVDAIEKGTIEDNIIIRIHVLVQLVEMMGNEVLATIQDGLRA